MRLNGFRCDACGKEHLLDPTLINQGIWDVMPDDWYTVSKGKGKYERGKEPLIVCSLSCLLQWVEKQDIVAHEHANTLTELKKVPFKRMLSGTWLPGDEE